jgi:hypothetical protein
MSLAMTPTMNPMIMVSKSPNIDSSPEPLPDAIEKTPVDRF